MHWLDVCSETQAGGHSFPSALALTPTWPSPNSSRQMAQAGAELQELMESAAGADRRRAWYLRVARRSMAWRVSSCMSVWGEGRGEGKHKSPKCRHVVHGQHTWAAILCWKPDPVSGALWSGTGVRVWVSKGASYLTPARLTAGADNKNGGDDQPSAQEGQENPDIIVGLLGRNEKSGGHPPFPTSTDLTKRWGTNSLNNESARASHYSH